MTDMPWTPDFETYPINARIRDAVSSDDAITLTWDDGLRSSYDLYLLRENSPEPTTIHPLSRELHMSILDLPEALRVERLGVTDDGVLEVKWGHSKITSRYHPGWLRSHAWFEDQPQTALPALTPYTLWDADCLQQPPSQPGIDTLEQPPLFLTWLETISEYGIARLRGLPDEDGLLEKIASRVGTLRESNFGRIYEVRIKHDPDSNAYTSVELPQHIDLPTREQPPGLQFLLCRVNSTSGGEGIYVDGFRIAQILREEHAEDFRALCEIPWVFNSRSPDFDYRSQRPVIALNADGSYAEIRFNAWLRAPLKAPLEQQHRAYRAFRCFARYAQDPALQLSFRYEPGDLLAFDNRRILHGRKAFSATGGDRLLEGVYMDRDELASRIRILRRTFGGQPSSVPHHPHGA